MNLLDIIRRHREAHPPREESERSETRAVPVGVNSPISLLSHPAPLPDADRCAGWLSRYIRGRYPKLADVKAAAIREGFDQCDVDKALASGAFVVYRSFPRRHIGEVEHVRTADDWPDDAPLQTK